MGYSQEEWWRQSARFTLRWNERLVAQSGEMDLGWEFLTSMSQAVKEDFLAGAEEFLEREHINARDWENYLEYVRRAALGD